MSMTEEQKKECQSNEYTTVHEYGSYCDEDCANCKLSYDFVVGFNKGYGIGNADGYDEAKDVYGSWD